MEGYVYTTLQTKKNLLVSTISNQFDSKDIMDDISDGAGGCNHAMFNNGDCELWVSPIWQSTNETEYVVIVVSFSNEVEEVWFTNASDNGEVNDSFNKLAYVAANYISHIEEDTL
jgi:hypothetical protein